MAAAVGAAIDHLSDDRVAAIDELAGGATGQAAMSDADGVWEQQLAASRVPAVEARSVPGGAGPLHRGEGDAATRLGIAGGDGGGATGARLGWRRHESERGADQQGNNAADKP